MYGTLARRAYMTLLVWNHCALPAPAGISKRIDELRQVQFRFFGIFLSTSQFEGMRYNNAEALTI